jgi:carbon monoxide dehydrogenase subunit G
MKVQLERSFALPAGAEVAWAFLQDIEAVTACMPGAKIVERIDAQNYKGTVAVRVGPASMSFKGSVEVQAIDAANRSLRLIGKGTDSTGSSAASMDLLARVDAVNAGSSTLVGNSTVTMSGRAATFGGRMMTSVADQVLKQFAENFAARVAAIESQRPAPPDTAAAAVAEKSANDSDYSGANDSANDGAAPHRAPPPPASNQLNGLALLWAVLKDWLRGLFAGKKA